ncbi:MULTISPECIES: tripartite tricarboxylate transporter substrate binding protein [Streptomyces]|uniref:Tripartite tricarboxylate transporter substrate binding protein n=1 Tax=Streptomyces phaeolivaceus TaxID=2653200 RepID=A0A5P8KEJ9_9ACTN|nr:tripartite tricarboxylate transporter substrate-binding protein [Streptomyces phaeolivaceus]QFR01572.1 tripartite tricarboxylate transporter substrate binding protein [Streptomyces phaeolivaceus]
MASARYLVTTAVVASLVTGCTTTDDEASDGSDYPSGSITMTAGADPGSGFDLTIRSVVEALKKEKIVDVPLPVENRPGASGAVWLAQMVERHRKADDEISVTSLSMMANELKGTSKYGYKDVTMLARLMTEYYVVVTAADSPYKDVGSVLSALRKKPDSVTVGAASDDQVPFGLLVSAAGADPRKVKYVEYQGGGDQTTALLNGDVDVAIAGVSEFSAVLKSGDLNGLAVLSEKRLPGLDVPTAAEQGYNVTLANWRGIYGPPDMPAYAVKYWQDALKRAVRSDTWKRIAKRNQWNTTFMTGDTLSAFLAQTQASVRKGLQETGQL